MSEKKNGEKKAKGGKRKSLASGTERISLWGQKVAGGLTKLSERTARWADKVEGKEGQATARDRLRTMTHLFSEAQKLIDQAISKADALSSDGWEPPIAAVKKTPDFAIGTPVSIKAEFTDFYRLIDKSALKNMKVGNMVKQGKRTNYVIPGVGFVPKTHLEALSAE